MYVYVLVPMYIRAYAIESCLHLRVMNFRIIVDAFPSFAKPIKTRLLLLVEKYK